MTEPVPFKPKHSYPTFTKIVDGKETECVDIDAMTEEQFKQFCRDTGSEWFQRFNVRM